MMWLLLVVNMNSCEYHPDPYKLVCPIVAMDHYKTKEECLARAHELVDQDVIGCHAVERLGD